MHLSYLLPIYYICLSIYLYHLSNLSSIMCDYLSIYYVYLIYHLLCLSIYYVYLSISLPIYHLLCLSIYLLCLSVYLFTYLSSIMSIYLPIYHLHYHPSIIDLYLSVSVCLPIHRLVLHRVSWGQIDLVLLCSLGWPLTFRPSCPHLPDAGAPSFLAYKFYPTHNDTYMQHVMSRSRELASPCP